MNLRPPTPRAESKDRIYLSFTLEECRMIWHRLNESEDTFGSRYDYKDRYAGKYEVKPIKDIHQKNHVLWARFNDILRKLQ